MTGRKISLIAACSQQRSFHHSPYRFSARGCGATSLRATAASLGSISLLPSAHRRFCILTRRMLACRGTAICSSWATAGIVHQLACFLGRNAETWQGRATLPLGSRPLSLPCTRRCINSRSTRSATRYKQRQARAMIGLWGWVWCERLVDGLWSGTLTSRNKAKTS